MLLVSAIFIIICLYLIYAIIPTYYYLIKYKHFKTKHCNNKEIFLTFDDGPSKEYTNKLLDLLGKYNVKASFFVVATFAKENENIIKRMKQEGHIIGLHSLEHSNALLKSPWYVKNDFKNSIKIMNDLGVSIRYFRPPWGHFNLSTVYEKNRYNLQVMLWQVMAEDWSGNTSAEIIKNKLLKRTKNLDIICLHDGRGKNEAPSRTIKALEEVIPIFLERGYKFNTVDKYYE